MPCQGVDDALGVVLTCTDDVTLVLLHLETEIRSCSFYTSVGIAKALLHLVNDVLLAHLVLITHTDNVLLGLAAAILQRYCHLQVTLRNSVDYSLCRVSYLTAKLLDASDAQMDYVSDAPAGHGLIKVGSCLVPFINELPRDTELYRLMTTKPGEQNA